MAKYSKRIKRLIREWAAEAYERELRRELTRLQESMAEWQRGEISSWEMSDRIHEWEVGPSRALFKHYSESGDLSVAYAIVVGVLDQEELPAELLEAISGSLEFFRSLRESGRLREREGRWWE